VVSIVARLFLASLKTEKQKQNKKIYIQKLNFKTSCVYIYIYIYIYIERERERERERAREREYLKEDEAVERTRGLGEVVAERLEELLSVGDV
jgi:hypothetical protein